MSIDARRWPLDFSELRKGDVLTTEQLVKIFDGARPEDSSWSLAVLKLRGQIKQQRPDLETKSDSGTIRVLHDDEIPERAADYVRSALRSLDGAKRVVETPITEELTDAQLRERESVSVAVIAVHQDTMASATKQSRTFAAIRARQLPEKLE
jgi:hypothetical protein